MTDEKKLTKEEVTKKTLEHFLDFTGANETKHNQDMYGKFGVNCGASVYEDFLGNDAQAKEIRKQIQDKDKADAEGVGNYEPVPIPQNFHVVQAILTQIQENQMRLKLGDLEKVVTGITGNLEFKVPEKLKEISYMEIMKKVMSEEKLTDDEKVAIKAYQVYGEAYKNFAAQKVMTGHYMDGVNAAGKELFKPYEELKDGDK